MKTAFKIISVGALIYALTQYGNVKVSQAKEQKTDSLWHYYNTTPEEQIEINKYLNSLKNK